MDKGFCEAINCELDSCDECLAKKYDEYVEETVTRAIKNLAGMVQGQEERGGGKSKLHIKNNLDGRIEFCVGLEEYKLEPGQHIAVNIEDGDFVYLDTLVASNTEVELLEAEIRRWIRTWKNSERYRRYCDRVNKALKHELDEIRAEPSKYNKNEEV